MTSRTSRERDLTTITFVGRLSAFCLVFMLTGQCGSWAGERTKQSELVTVQQPSAASRSSLVASGEQQKTERHKKKGFVTIATIGAAPVSVGGVMTPQQVVDRVIAHWRSQFAQVLPDCPDLIVVPEACDRPSGFSAEKLAEYYRVRKNQVRDFFAGVAREHHCYVVYSAHRFDEAGRKHNSSVLIDRTGHIAGIYDKNHPTIGEIEGGIVPGGEAPVFETDFGRVGMAICFDLNFDELRLKYAKASPDLIIFSSMYHGGLMQAYWAYSCRCHFVGAIAGRGTPSQILNPLGQLVASSTNYFDFAVARVNLDCTLAHLDENWSKLRALKAKYGPKVQITDPGRLGPVLIASEHDTVDVNAMIGEFEIELLDHYFARSLDRRRTALNQSR